MHVIDSRTWVLCGDLERKMSTLLQIVAILNDGVRVEIRLVLDSFNFILISCRKSAINLIYLNSF